MVKNRFIFTEKNLSLKIKKDKGNGDGNNEKMANHGQKVEQRQPRTMPEQIQYQSIKGFNCVTTLSGQKDWSLPGF